MLNISEHKKGGTKMMNLFSRLVREEEGQGMVEYGLIIALIALVVIVALTGIGDKLKTVFTNISIKMPSGS